MQEIANMTKSELVELVKNLQSKQGGTRGAELLSLLGQGSDLSVPYLCEQMNVNSRNLSSIKSGLKKSEEWGVQHVIMTYKVSGESVWKLINQDDPNWEMLSKLA